MADTVIEFLSRECKTGQHKNCSGKWQRLGYEISCSCVCGHKKNRRALELVHQPVSNTNQDVQPFFMPGALHQEND